MARTLQGLMDCVRPDVLLVRTCRLVSTPSVVGNETAVMEAAAAMLRPTGAAVSILARTPERPNVVATLWNGPGPTLVFNGHLDTVPPGNRELWESDPFQPTQRGDRLFGLGALDMKGSCAAMLHAFEVLAGHPEAWRGEIQLQLVCDEEESGHFGTHYLIELMQAGKLSRPAWVIGGEYSDLRVMNAERGSFKFQIRFRGHSTHTATARVDGVNAIRHAAVAILTLERDLTRFHPEIGLPVISINKVEGGKHLSQVPGECVITVDRRLVLGEDKASALNEARQELDRLARETPGFAYEILELRDSFGRERYGPPNATHRDSPVVGAVREAHRLATGAEPEWFVDWFGASDGRLFRYEGIDMVTYGPGGRGAHAANEYVEVPSLTVQAKTCVAAATLLLRPEGPGEGERAPLRTRSQVDASGSRGA